MLHIAVCDDEPIVVAYLTSLVHEWSCNNKTQIQVSNFNSAESFLFSYSQDRNIDILLLDIQMKAMDGISLAEKIRETDAGMQIVFITGFPDYIEKGYDVSALHYLLKPIEKEKLWEVLSKAKTNLQKCDPFLLIFVNDENIKVNCSEIVYIEAFGHVCEIVCKDKKYIVRLSLSEIADRLDESFIQCHRSYVANLRHVLKISKTDIVFENAMCIPVSRRLYNDVNVAFIGFYRGLTNE